MARKKIEPAEATTAEVMNYVALGEYQKLAAQFEAGLAILNKKLPSRATSRQLLTIMAVASAATSKERITITDIQARFGEADDGSDIGANLAKSYLMFLPSSPKDPEALGWLIQQPDPSDGRRKYLTLTDAGRMAVLNIFQAMERA